MCAKCSAEVLGAFVTWGGGSQGRCTKGFGHIAPLLSGGQELHPLQPFLSSHLTPRGSKVLARCLHVKVAAMSIFNLCCLDPLSEESRLLLEQSLLTDGAGPAPDQHPIKQPK